MTFATKRGRSWRPWQMRLRTLMALMAIAAITASIYGWRQRREEHLLRLVVTFNAAMEVQRYEEADRVARNAVEEFPGDFIAINMREKSRLALSIVNGTLMTGGFVCGTGTRPVSTINDDVSTTGGDNGRDP